MTDRVHSSHCGRSNSTPPSSSITSPLTSLSQRPACSVSLLLPRADPERQVYAAAGAQAASIYKGEKFSDHAPLTIEYDWHL